LIIIIQKHTTQNDGNKLKDRIRLREKETNKFKDFPLSGNAKSALKEYLKTREYTANIILSSIF